MLSKLLERLKNQELTQQEEQDIQEQIVKINNQLEANKQSRRTKTLIDIKNDEKKSKELKEIKQNLYAVRKKDRIRGYLSVILTIPLTFLAVGGVIGSILLSALLKFSTIGFILMMAGSLMVSAGMVTLCAMQDIKLRNKYKAEERDLLIQYNNLLFDNSLENLNKNKESLQTSETRIENTYKRDEDLSEDLVQESNVESF